MKKLAMLAAALAFSSAVHADYPAKTIRLVVHIAGELLKLRTGANLTHVPYKGGGPAMTDALGGNIPLVYTAVAGAIQHVKTGRLVGIAISSAARSPSLPDVPTFIESGVPDFDIS